MRARIACTIARKPATPIGAEVVVLRGRAVDAADADIVEQIERRGLRLLHGLDAEPDDRGLAEQPPRIGRRHVVLPDMHAVGFGRERHVDAVVDQQRNIAAAPAPP